MKAVVDSSADISGEAECSSDRNKNLVSNKPHLVVLSTLFPTPNRPVTGIFIQERMFRVAREMPITFVVPVPWFPFQSLLRRLRPHFRPAAPRREMRDGQEILYPRFFCVPGLLKSMDGLFMAFCLYPLFRRLKRDMKVSLIDAHFAYPDGYAAARLGQWLKLPVTITIRGTEPRLVRRRWGRRAVLRALSCASRVFSVSNSLRQEMVAAGSQASGIRVVPNGVDMRRFACRDQAQARQRLGLPLKSQILITVGGLVERKGQHRVIECLPGLLQQFPQLHYLIVGGASPEGDWERRLRALVGEHGLENRVSFLGIVSPCELAWPLSAADVFVLATRNEGWANVLLEAMACGLPIIATDVGGNREVVSDSRLGSIVPFGDSDALQSALAQALRTDWDREYICNYARNNSWDDRVTMLVAEFTRLSTVAGPRKS